MRSHFARRSQLVVPTRLVFLTILLATAGLIPKAADGGARAAPTPHPAVARIIAVERNGASLGSGTLVAVSEHHGLVITNWHVVRDAEGNILVKFPCGFVSPATVMKVDKDWDLAALAIWRPPVDPVPIAVEAPRPGDPLAIAGYGSGDYRMSFGRCTQYVAPSTHHPFEMVELNTTARQGDSGGPIFNAKGELAGVLFGSGNHETMGSYCGRVRWFLADLKEPFYNLPPPPVGMLASAPGQTPRLSAREATVQGTPSEKLHGETGPPGTRPQETIVTAVPASPVGGPIESFTDGSQSWAPIGTLTDANKPASAQRPPLSTATSTGSPRQSAPPVASLSRPRAGFEPRSDSASTDWSQVLSANVAGTARSENGRPPHIAPTNTPADSRRGDFEPMEQLSAGSRREVEPTPTLRSRPSDSAFAMERGAVFESERPKSAARLATVGNLQEGDYVRNDSASVYPVVSENPSRQIEQETAADGFRSPESTLPSPVSRDSGVSAPPMTTQGTDEAFVGETAPDTAKEPDPPREVVIGVEDLLGKTLGERIRNLLAVVGCLTILSYVFRAMGGSDPPRRAKYRR
ncbi:S1 family peptidase [Thermostilla marina]